MKTVKKLFLLITGVTFYGVILVTQSSVEEWAQGILKSNYSSYEDKNIHRNHKFRDIHQTNTIQNTSGSRVQFITTKPFEFQFNSSFLNEQRRRIRHLSSKCREEGVKNQGLNLMNTIIDRLDGLTFCPVYKSASTSWTVLLLQLRNKWNGNYDHLLDRLKSTFKVVSNRQGIKLSKGTIRFTVVRHPFERLVSCYRDKIENINKLYYYQQLGEHIVKTFREVSDRKYNPKQKKQFLAQVMKLAKAKRTKSKLELPNNPYANPPGPTFEEFVRYVVSNAHDNEHWIPYTEHCSLCDVHFDFILKFENLREESDSFLDYLDISSKVSLRWDNPTKVGNDTARFERVCSYMKQLNFDLAIRVKQKYASDLLLMEYDAEKYMSCSKGFISD